MGRLRVFAHIQGKSGIICEIAMGFSRYLTPVHFRVTQVGYFCWIFSYVVKLVVITEVSYYY